MHRSAAPPERKPAARQPFHQPVERLDRRQLKQLSSDTAEVGVWFAPQNRKSNTGAGKLVIRILALELGTQHSQIRKMQIRQRTAASLDAVGDCASASLGKIQVLCCELQPGLFREHIDEAVGHGRGHVQAPLFYRIQLLRDLSGTERLACGLLLPKLEHPAEAERRFCAIGTRQIASARDVLQLHPDRERRGQGIQFGLVPCRGHRSALGLQYRAPIQRAADRLFQCQIPRLKRRGEREPCPGKCQGQPLKSHCWYPPSSIEQMQSATARAVATAWICSGDGRSVGRRPAAAWCARLARRKVYGWRAEEVEL